MPEKKIYAVRRFVRKHKVAVAIITTTALMLALNRRNINAYNDFLREHDLFDAYWNSEE